MHLRAMLILLSPAKDMDLSPVSPPLATTTPALITEATELAAGLRKCSVRKLADLMDLSPKLAQLAHGRYQRWGAEQDHEEARPAAYLFNGEAYRGLQFRTFDTDDVRRAQRQLRILSGLYGILRPLDMIRSYRLMMGTPFAPARGKKDLYSFWGDRITDQLNATLAEQEDDLVVDLASSEYGRSVRSERLKARRITPVFKEQGPKGPVMVMVYAKHQRGAMSRWIIRQRVQEAEALKEYDGDGYRFDAKASTADQWVFMRPKPPLKTARAVPR